MNPTFIITAVLISLTVLTVVLFNQLIREKNMVREAWSGIDVQLKLRHDLIPRLVQVAEGFAAFEKKTLQDLVQLREQGTAASTLSEKARAEAALTREVHNFIVRAEKYPELKTNQNFLDLQKNVTQVEERLQMARRYYNGCVRNYNTRLETIPSTFVARALNYQPAEFFQADDAEREVPA